MPRTFLRGTAHSGANISPVVGFVKPRVLILRNLYDKHRKFGNVKCVSSKIARYTEVSAMVRVLGFGE